MVDWAAEEKIYLVSRQAEADTASPMLGTIVCNRPKADGRIRHRILGDRMYGFSADLKLEGVAGSEIQQICLGRYDVQFLFGSGTRICVQSFVEVFQGEDLIATWDEQNNWTTSSFQKLVSVMVDNYTVINERVMEIRLQDGLRLRLHDNSKQFESLQIYPDFIVI